MTSSRPSDRTMELERAFGSRLLRDEPLARHCWLEVGGPADLFLAVLSRTELERAVTLAGGAGLPLLVLGKGANVLPSDAGVRGLVIRNVASAMQFERRDMLVMAESGASMQGLARRLAREGIGGLEWGTGIPGTVGGATVNNAGAHGSCVADVLESSTTIDATGTVRDRPAATLDYQYRKSALKGSQEGPPRLHEIVLASTFRLYQDDPHTMQERIAVWAEERRQRQPLRAASAGSFFKNPPGDYAGRLIEAAGLKGLTCGGAQVATLHGNFLTNAGGATATDVYRLGQEVRARVQDSTGISLHMEVEMVGDWSAILHPS